MIKTPLSTVIGGAGIWTPGCTVLGGQQNIDQIIKSLFSNNEVGFAYDPNDLTTLYQDVAGTIPVTGAGQAVGLVLDKSKGLVLGAERVVNGNFDDLSAWSEYNAPIRSVQNGILKLEAKPLGSSGTFQDISLPNHSTCKVVVRARKVSGASAARIMIMPRTSNFNTPNTAVEIIGDSFKDYTFYISKEADATGIRVYLQIAASDAVIEVDSVSVKGIAGNHAYQTTSASRSILRDAPQRIDFDAVDDKLITNLPAQLTGCTVVRSVPNVGTQILTNQTIPTPYNDNTDHCGLIVINRALTTAETAQITQLFNKAAGV